MSADRTNVVPLPAPSDAVPSLLPKCCIAFVGACPFVLPSLRIVGIDVVPGWSLIVGGGAAASLALAATTRL